MTDISHYHQSLTSEKTQLVAELNTIARYDEHTGDWVAVPPTDSSQSADENNQADVAEAWNERRALLAQLEMRFHNVQLALQKITDGSFGTCEICQEPIEPERLEVNAASRTCKLHLERARELPL